MFFTLSKVLWFFADPGNLLLMALVLGTGLLWTRWRRLGKGVLAVVALAAAVLTVVPVGEWLYQALEDRFPVPAVLPASVDGIVVAGGIVDPVTTAARGQAAIGGASERLFALAALARRYPRAKLVFSGGSGRLLHPDKKEAPAVAPLIRLLGIEPARVIFEDRSRNTWENARFSLAVANPKPDETWLLVTSAFHMPRAVGCFRKLGWRVVPYPVDFATAGDAAPPLRFNFAVGVGSLGGALHELLGLLIYRLAGKTDALFPAPQ